MAIFNLSGGGQPVLQSKQAIPSESQQIILPDEGYDGLSKVDIDATPLETRTVNPSTSSQIITPSSSSIGFSSVTVNPMKLQSKSITPTSVPYSVSPDSGYNGLSSVAFGKDANLTADNIVKGKKIYGVSGNAAYPMLVSGSITDTTVGTSITIQLPSTITNMSMITSIYIICGPGSSYTSRNDILSQCHLIFTNTISDYLGTPISSTINAGGEAIMYGGNGAFPGLLQTISISLSGTFLTISNITLNDSGDIKTLSIGGAYTGVSIIGYSGNPVKI